MKALIASAKEFSAFVPQFPRMVLRLLAQFLEARIIPERIEHRIEPEQRRSERHV